MSGEVRPHETENTLVRDHLDLVGQVVARVSARYPRHVDRQELWNAGALGLVEAARRYDPAAGIPFDRYASIRVRGAIIDSTRSRDWASRSVRRRYREMEDAGAAFTERSGRAPNQKELAKTLGVTDDELHQIQARSQTSMLLYLDNETDDTGMSLRDTVVETATDIQPEAALEHKEMMGTLTNAVEHLPGVHSEVVRRYYLQGELLQDIAQELGVTQARVSQIRAEALTALRAWFGSLYEGIPDVPDSAPGKRARTAFVAELASQSTWRTRFDHQDEQVIERQAAGS